MVDVWELLKGLSTFLIPHFLCLRSGIIACDSRFVGSGLAQKPHYGCVLKTWSATTAGPPCVCALEKERVSVCVVKPIIGTPSHSAVGASHFTSQHTQTRREREREIRMDLPKGSRPTGLRTLTSRETGLGSSFLHCCFIISLKYETM